MRLRADFWVAAYLRRCDIEGIAAVRRRRGAPEAGAVYVKLDRLDGRAALFGPAPQTEVDREGDRVFIRLHKDEWIDPADAEARIAREISFDPDIWVVEIEDREGRMLLDLA
jgi:hypothetical protein